jgi:hypothetical protein
VQYIQLNPPKVSVEDKCLAQKNAAVHALLKRNPMPEKNRPHASHSTANKDFYEQAATHLKPL